MVRYLYLMGVLFAVLPVSRCFSQGFQVVFPGLTGNDLIDSVAQQYRPSVVLDYANARDTLYAKILAADDDSLRCIYSGHTLYLDPGADPTQYVFQNGGTNGINTEHAYPQAKGAIAGTNAHSDMHHLFPTRVAVNEARGDKPFAEIPDAQTQKWFLNNQVFTTIPNQHIDSYAESGSATFEPREAVKGDLARSILYFYTVYRSQANEADPNFFALQRSTLCQWNAQDPADSAELHKTWRIADYQEGKPNPFVIDCSLAKRSWCPETAQNCFLSALEQAVVPNIGVQIFPQPASGPMVALLQLPFDGDIRVRLISALGESVAVMEVINAPAGAFELPMDFSQWQKSATWMGYIEINLLGSTQFARKTSPLLLTR